MAARGHAYVSADLAADQFNKSQDKLGEGLCRFVAPKRLSQSVVAMSVCWGEAEVAAAHPERLRIKKRASTDATIEAEVARAVGLLMDARARPSYA